MQTAAQTQCIAARGVDVAQSASPACDERMPQSAMLEATGELSSTTKDCSSGVWNLHGGSRDGSDWGAAMLQRR
jgi:hypothetical protein